MATSPRSGFLVVGLLLICVVAVAGGCKSQPRVPRGHAEAGAWQLTIWDVDEARHIAGGSVVYEPVDGQIFVEVELTLTNATQETRKFSWQGCELPHPQGSFIPVAVVPDSFPFEPIENVDVLGPGDSVDRKISFGYPEEDLPREMICKQMVLPLHFDDDFEQMQRANAEAHK